MSIRKTLFHRPARAPISIRKIITIAYFLAAQNHYFASSFLHSLGTKRLFAMRARLPRRAHLTAESASAQSIVKDEVAVAAIEVEAAEVLTKKRKTTAKSLPSTTAATTAAVTIQASTIVAVKLHPSTTLVELGELTPMVVVSRPSLVIKTPYVADLIMKTAEYCRADFLSPSESSSSAVPSEGTCKAEGTPKKVSKKGIADLKIAASKALSNSLRQTVAPESVHLGHTPALDCAGMIVPGAVVYCTANDAHTKSRYTVQFCEEQREDGGVVTVACHPNLAERAARVLLEEQLLSEELGVYDATKVLRQQTFGNSRVDFVLQNEGENSITLVEVKNVVGADYKEGLVPLARCEVGVYSVASKLADGSDYRRHAIFPHGSKKAEVGVVSDRAIKHIHELSCMQGTTDSQGRSVRSAILFIINRSDCEAFRPCHEADMLFAQMLLRAHESGVLIIAKEIVWTDGTGLCGRTLPVSFDESVTSAIDEEWLQRVLLFNENGSGRTPSPSKRKMKKEEEDGERHPTPTPTPKKASSKKKSKKVDDEDEEFRG